MSTSISTSIALRSILTVSGWAKRRWSPSRYKYSGTLEPGWELAPPMGEKPRLLERHGECSVSAGSSNLLFGDAVAVCSCKLE